jgi:acetylornithine deacetylase/succinyl-diaminopimelate desuccinylase-like protein
VITGSDKTNTIPQFASAELDIRLLPDEDPEAFKRELVRVVGDTGVKLALIAPIPPRFDAPLGTPLFQAIERVVGGMLPGVPVATPISPGATDRPTYARAGLIAYGVDPYLIPVDEYRLGVHGNDERLSMKNIGWGVEFYLRLLHEVQ